MTASDQLAFLRDPRLAAHAVSAWPAWLWAEGAAEILWANPTGAAIFGAATPAKLTGRRFDARDPAAQQIVRLAGALPAGGAPRLERLRGFGAGVGRMLICSCARITLADGRSAIIVVAGAPAGPSLPLAERVRRLFSGNEGPIAVFSHDGDLLYLGDEGKPHIGDATTLAAAGAGALAAEALANGRAAGDTAHGALTLERIGSGNATVLLATFDRSAASPAAEPEPPISASHDSSLGEEATPLPDQPMGEEATSLPHEPVGEEATPLPSVAPALHDETTAPAPMSEPEPNAEPSIEETATVAAQESLLATVEPPAVAKPMTPPLPHVVEADPAATAAPLVEPHLVAAPQGDDGAPLPASEPEPSVHAVPEQPFSAVSEPAQIDVVASAHQPADVTDIVPQAAPPAPPSEPAPMAVAADLPDMAPAAEVPAVPQVEAPLVETPLADVPVAAEPPPLPAPPPERHHPLRFVWQTDADERFTVGSEDFMGLLGPGVANLIGRSWGEIAAKLALDPEGRIARALGSHDTWSGVTVAWPVDGASERLIAELSGLPMFDRDRAFRGYRGFGVCRDIAAMNAIIAARYMPPPAPIETPAEPVALVAPAPAPIATPEPVLHEPAGADAPAADISAPATVDEAPPLPPEPVSAEQAPPEAASPEQIPPEPVSHEPAATDAPTVADTDEPPAREPRPQLTLVPPAKNIVPFRSPSAQPAERRPMLTPVERTAFQEIAKALGARVEGTDAGVTAGAEPATAEPEAAAPPPAAEATPLPPESPADGARPRQPVPSAYASGSDIPSIAAAGKSERAVLDRVPVGVLVYRGERLLYANNTLLDWTGYEDLDAIVAAGGLERLFTEPGVTSLGETNGSGRTFALTTRRGDARPVEGRMFSVTWAGETALLTVLTSSVAQERLRDTEQVLTASEQRLAASEQAIEDIEERIGDAEKALRTAEEKLKISELSLRAAEAATRELESVLDTATDGVIVVNRDGVILASNRSAEALFGYESRELASRAFVDLFAPESHRAAHDYLTGLTRPGVASLLNDGREVIGRVAQGGLMPLFMTIGRIADGTDKFCAVFRDITQWKRAEEDLTNAKREAEKASSAKSDFLAKVSHEIRTPMNAIIGFSEVMMEERFGAIGNDRYKQYLKDIHTSGEHVVSLVNDLLDLSKIEAGKLDLNFASVELNDVVSQCVAIMQPQANRERIIIRTSLPPTLPPVVADERSVRQIVLNLLSNSIKFTGAGGQVIVSTALTDHGEEVLRVRDTGVGMTEKELSTALEPFRQVATAGRTGPGTGLGLPLTKALAEANRATFTIKSAVDAGTLVEIAFPANRVLAE
jgi:PAS domain S-box-containing protein